MTVRRAAVAGTWYPGSAAALGRDVRGMLDAAGPGPSGDVRAIVSPHAGLMYSGAVAAWAWRAVSAATYDVAVLVGPSHYVGFDGLAVFPDGAFDTPLGPAPIDAAGAAAILAHPIARASAAPHVREHSLEMQLPFLRICLPDVPIVPVLMGYQSADTIRATADALVSAVNGRRALLAASTDLSHYFDARTAVALDARVLAAAEAFDPEALLTLFEQYPEHERGRYVACGGGPAIAVMLAAGRLGAIRGAVLKYAHSGEVSGDNDAVVGYMAAAMGTW